MDAFHFQSRMHSMLPLLHVMQVRDPYGLLFVAIGFCNLHKPVWLLLSSHALALLMHTLFAVADILIWLVSPVCLFALYGFCLVGVLRGLVV